MDGSRHPQILKEYLKDNISIETLVILDRILGFRKKTGTRNYKTSVGNRQYENEKEKVFSVSKY